MEKLIWVRGSYEREETIMRERKVLVEGVEETWGNICLGSLRGTLRSQAEA